MTAIHAAKAIRSTLSQNLGDLEKQGKVTHL